MATMQSWRKAYGAIKDSTTVGLANLNSDFKDLDVAIVKATNHVERPPKERHVRKILAATSVARPRVDIAYCIHALSRRLAKTRNWTVALKTLIVIHRLLREGDPTFQEELLNFSQRARILQLSNFKDDSSPIAWDCSAWVRTYALFLEERLECFRILKYDIEAERLTKPPEGLEKGHSRTRELDTEDLLEQLPALQQLLHHLIGCRPEGAAVSNYVIQYALALVLKESFKIYCAINDGIINLVDKFFEMPRHEAIKASEIYRRAGQQAGGLSEFYETCRGLELARNFQFPNLKEPPRSFLSTMEDYIREAPRIVSVPKAMEFPERLLLTYKPEEAPDIPEDEEVTGIASENGIPSVDQQPDEPNLGNSNEIDTVPPKTDGDLLGLNDFTMDASGIEESNALALAIVPSGNDADAGISQGKAFDPSGWELALVTAPSGSTNATPIDSHMAGGFDKLTLDSLYDEAAYRQQQQQQQQAYGSAAINPFLMADPFATSTQIAAPPAVQMAAMAQQQQQMSMAPNPFGQAVYQPQMMMGNAANPMMMGNAANPFVDPAFGAFPTTNHQHQVNPFGNNGLI